MAGQSLSSSNVNKAIVYPDKGSQEKSNIVGYIATVVDILPLLQQIVVSIDGGSANNQVFWVSSLFSSLTGLSIKSYPQIGQKVIVIRNTFSNTGIDWCIGAYSGADAAADWMVTDNYIGLDDEAAFCGTGDSIRGYTKDKILLAGNYPKDIVDGEGSLGLAHGPAVDFLQNLVRLKATDLAKIEAYVLDDFIRILSQNYEHLSAFGDFKILNNQGSLDVIWRGTSNEHETFGKEQENESKDIEVKKNSINLDDPSKEEALLEDGKWRFQQYVGKLGNFIHTFITEPQKMLDAKNENPISARSKVYNGFDGTYLVQSVSEIAFEKVIRIPVPVLQCPPEELEMSKLKLDAFQQWLPEDEDALYETSYKFLDYGRWLANYFSLAVFHGLEKASVKPESEYSAPTFNVGDKKLQSPLSALQSSFPDYITKYATMRIFKDGSILMLNGYGCAVHMAGKDITMSSPRDININAAGAVNITGNDINLTARKCIDIVAALRGICIKAQTWLEVACEKGSILLESCMSQKQEDTPTIEDDLLSEDKIGKAYEGVEGLNGGIIIKSRFTNIILSAGLGGIVSKCRFWFNTAQHVLFKATNFLVEKILSLKLGEMNVGAAIVNMKAVYTDILSNKTATKVLKTGQDGLTQKHDENKVNEESLTLSGFNENISSLESATKLLENKVEIENSDLPEFGFRDSIDALSPQYEKSYQNVTNQLIENCYDKKKEFFDPDTWEAIFNKAPLTGYPFYPNVEVETKSYTPKASSVKPFDDTPKANPATMKTSKNEWFHKPDQYNDAPFYETK